MMSLENSRLFFENCREAIFITTPRGRGLYINPACVELFGYESREEMLCLDIETDIYVDPGARKRFMKKIGEDSYVKEYRLELKRKNGSRLIALVTATAIRDEKGDVVEYQGIYIDITGREQERETLRESLDRLDLALKTAEMGVWHWDIVNGRVGFDDQSCRMLGIDPATFRGTREEYYSAIHPEDREKVRAALYRRIELEDNPQKVEYRVVRPDGQVRYITGQGKVIRDENGRPIKMQGVHWDITEYKQAVKELSESRERFRRMIQNSNDVISLLDENGIIIFQGDSVERITGYKAEELIGRSAFEIVHPEDAQCLKRLFADGLHQPGAVVQFEYRHHHKNGNWVVLESIASNLLHDPAVRAIVINDREVSERNRLQEQLRQAMKMEAIGRLAGGVAHDFNNILTVITGNIELARMDIGPDDPVARHLNNIMRATESAESLTQRLLAFSRKQILEPRVLNLNDLIRNFRNMLGRLIGEDIKLDFALADGLGSVRIDSGQFEQVLMNLAVNARDAMPQGGTLKIQTANITVDEGCGATHPQLQPGRYVMLKVSDTGHGISSDNKKHIFEPFFTTKSQGQGTGFGLPTILGIVQQAGGIIECHSEEGSGATFRIYLPLLEEPAERLIRERRSVERLKGDEAILLAEDDECVREMAMTMLEDLGYRTIAAASGEEALELAGKYSERIDLLMTDVVMPGINGRELSERLTRQRPQIKTLFCSGYTEDIIVLNGVIDRSINFIAKPYSMQQLAGKIREALGTQGNSRPDSRRDKSHAHA